MRAAGYSRGRRRRQYPRNCLYETAPLYPKRSNRSRFAARRKNGDDPAAASGGGESDGNTTAPRSLTRSSPRIYLAMRVAIFLREYSEFLRGECVFRRNGGEEKTLCRIFTVSFRPGEGKKKKKKEYAVGNSATVFRRDYTPSWSSRTSFNDRM